MKSYFYLLLACVGFLLICAQIVQVHATANVAELYCAKLGEDFGNYSYQTREEEAGQRGVCVLPDNQQVDAWDFFTGKVAVEYSYCAKRGYESISKPGGIFSSDQQVCIVKDIDFLPGIEVPMANMIDLNYKEEDIGGIMPAKVGSPPGNGLPEYSSQDFSNWDWRNPPVSTKWAKNNYPFFDEINGWLTSIKDQSSCRACWSFGTLGSIESKYKINSNNSLLDPDLSEQYLVSDCCTACGNCNGGSRYASFEYIMRHGISDEQCFKYRGADSGCIPCVDQVSRLWKIDDYVVDQYAGVSDVKQKIIDSGPVTIIMNWGGTWDDNCVYKCDGNENEGTHIVVLAGYNDTGDVDTGYWIAKNSFGLNWPGRCNIGDGYFKLGFDTCSVGATLYPKRVSAPDFKPSIVLNSPANGFLGQGPVVNFGFTVHTKILNNRAKCYLWVDGIQRKYLIVNDGKPSTMSDRFDMGKHSWKIECWEEKMGINASSETRNFELKFQGNDEEKNTYIYLTEPYDHYSSNGNVTLKCEAYDSRKINNLSLYINISGWTLIITNNLCDQNCYLEYTGLFEKGSYKWNCLVDGSNKIWARDNFTFNILNESVNGSGTGGPVLNDPGEFNGGLGLDFKTSLGACSKSSKRCWSTSVLQQCIEGKWGNLQFCAYGCDSSILRCKSCREGERRCSEDSVNVLVCSQGSWKTQLCSQGCDGSECISGSQEANESDLNVDVYLIFGSILLVLIVVLVIIVLLVRRRNNAYADRNTKFMKMIKNGI
jgi:putative hemolysin